HRSRLNAREGPEGLSTTVRTRIRSPPFEGTAMQTWFIACCPVLLLLFASGPAEGAPPGFEEQTPGSWAAADQIPNRLLSRLVVLTDDKGWWVEVWAVRGLKEEAIQKAPLHLLREG